MLIAFKRERSELKDIDPKKRNAVSRISVINLIFIVKFRILPIKRKGKKAHSSFVALSFVEKFKGSVKGFGYRLYSSSNLDTTNNKRQRNVHSTFF